MSIFWQGVGSFVLEQIRFLKGFVHKKANWKTRNVSTLDK